jgi:hypothetical protein
MHGRRLVLTDERQRAPLLDRIIAPVVERYARHSAVCAWDIINEPEWATTGLGGVDPHQSVPHRTMKAFITEVAALVHQTASQPVTVGLASARGLDLVRACGLDFYQVHWYDHLDTPIEDPVARFRLDQPVILGEYPTRGSHRSPETILHLAREAGYAGAWFWSVRAGDGASDYSLGVGGVDRFLAATASGPRSRAL